MKLCASESKYVIYNACNILYITASLTERKEISGKQLKVKCILDNKMCLLNEIEAVNIRDIMTACKYIIPNTLTQSCIDLALVSMHRKMSNSKR